MQLLAWEQILDKESQSHRKMSSGAVFAGGSVANVTRATIISVRPDQTSNLAKEFTPFESKTKSGQFVLQSPNGSIDPEGWLMNWFS